MGQGLSLVAATPRILFSCTLVAELTRLLSFALCVAATDATSDRCTAAPHGGAVDCSADGEQAERREQGQQMTSAVPDV